MTAEVAGKKMVAGFLFSGERVLLVQKTRPEWQRGLLNGVGGLIEAHETPLQAMDREFREETSYGPHLEWQHFATEIEPFNAYVYFYRAVLDNTMSSVWPTQNDVGERLIWQYIPYAQRIGCLGNLNWLIPLAQDWRGLKPVTVEATLDIRERSSW